ncbi:hypothetical protein COCMIDRAFT_87821 [Bipolaris oryzae ATCC 44560]|uniref:HMG box domain-containing protein n=1 Tax=Bipolaris oryzae ATCC 44560 TaxID=930090 RepID=W6Z936_COCMI|nr:uncharacterized protein COCMIDRAFT_87821 [Bipolaris oryzae ATCC 44560]EUC48227.1 hypothetical protein COCMIDRAFT_87821 [Bipolaris oryzae ATCC 44560]
MRFVSRLHVCAALAIFTILYITWMDSAGFEETVHTVWRGSAHRIVVFGNDWSDTGSYRVSSPALSSIVARDADRGDLWVETLCKELECDTIDNFAHSVPIAADGAQTDALLDAAVYEDAMGSESNDSAVMSFDFKAQVEQFVTYNKGRRLIPQRLRKEDEWTFFAVYFGLWDLLEYSTLEKSVAMYAIDKSITSLFRQLDVLAADAPFPPKVIIPKMIDVSFLPRFQMKKKAMHEAQFAETQHRLIFLWSYWNLVLHRTANNWKNGIVYMPEANEAIMQEVRAKQLHSKQLSDAFGVGKQAPLFEHIEQPCLASQRGSAGSLQASDVQKCSTPAEHLFWDDVQLSGPAHALIGNQAVSLIRGNQSVGREQQTQGSDNKEKPEKQEAEHFTLKFPPGSTMQTEHISPQSPIDVAKHPRSLRKSSRIQETRSNSMPDLTTEHNCEDDPSPTGTSSPRNTRKRLISLVEASESEESGSPTDEKLPPSATSTTAGSPDFVGHVCLCQPEPKIPRPRNAFILYRQHHQQVIIARNPGLNNPDISKIIGEQWKAEPEERKKIWQDLAQEEKARHQEQYPDYRYQPRRIGKSGSSPLNPFGQHTTVDKYRCQRCGGRSIKTPTSPYLDPSGIPILPPPNITESITPTTRYLPVISNLSMESPVHPRGHGPPNLNHLKLRVTSAIRDDPAATSPSTPNKKRRFEYGHPNSALGLRADGPYFPSTQYARRESLPPIQIRYSPPNSATMPPPRTPRDGRLSIVEVGPSSHSSSPKSVEEVLSAYAYGNKIKLLGRITPPYKELREGMSSGQEGRGAIIAIEGDDLAAVKELSEWLNEHLAKQGEFKPQITEPPRVPGNDGKDVTFDDYLDLIKEWHGKSKEMIEYITTASSAASPCQDIVMSDKDTSSTSITASRKDSAMLCDSPAATLKPVIILPTFQLHASVAYASRIPIQDAYSAMDHWQWMATLWRGTVGPDLTLYVKSYDAKEGQIGQKPEMDDPSRCFTVFKEKEGKFTEPDLRRVGFEVGEWIKAVR